MLADYSRFPDPPPGVPFTLERRPDGLALTHDQMPVQFRGSFGLASGCIGLWTLGVVVMFLFGVVFALLALGVILLSGGEAPEVGGVLGVLGFLVVWVGVGSLMLWAGLRLRSRFTGSAPVVGWRLEIGPTGWRSLRYQGMTPTVAQCRQDEVRSLEIRSTGQLFARLEDNRMLPLTGPLRASEAAWLGEALTRCLGLPPPSRAEPLSAVPDGDLSDRPGSTLAYRLPESSAERATLFGCAWFALIWNAVVGVFLTIVVLMFLEGEPNWLLTVFLIPFVLIGLAALFGLVRQLLLVFGVGPTEVEVAVHPLPSGGSCELLVRQKGRLTLRSLEVVLVCQERATYRQGTDTTTDVRLVFREELLQREGFTVSHDMPWEGRSRVRIPPRMMHSFHSPHNEIVWSVVVKGVPAGRPRFERTFPLVVVPASPGGGA